MIAPASIAALVAMAALQVADGLLTIQVLRAGGREQNPLMRTLFSVVGVTMGLVLSKVVLLGLAMAFLHDQLGLLICLCLFYAWVVAHNWRHAKAATVELKS